MRGAGAPVECLVSGTVGSSWIAALYAVSESPGAGLLPESVFFGEFVPVLAVVFAA